MEIKYAENPLATIVIPDERDILLLKAKAEIDRYDNIICYYNIYSDPESKQYDPVKAKAELDYSNIYPNNFDQMIDSCVNDWISDLATEHVGDCTCVPCSCSKCHVENHLGIDTIEGLRKHQANKISGAFSLPNILTCDDCIDHLENAPAYVPKNDWTDAHIPRWTQERIDAIAWLKVYRREKLGR